MVTPFLGFVTVGTGPIPGNVEAIAVKLGMTRHRIGSAISVLAAEDAGNILDLRNGGGAIVGTVFDRFGPAARRKALEPREADEIGRDPIATLRDRFWGGYVAFVRRGEEVVVIRDPSGTLPCYYAVRHGTHIFSSSPGLLVDLGLVRAEPDLDEVLRQYWSMFLPSDRTALQGIAELPPGTSLRISSQGSTVQSNWSPWDFVDPDPAPTSVSVEARMRETVLSCTRSWASCFDHVMLGFSGGLDSSVVAAGLAARPASVTLLNMVTTAARGDERAFARAGAKHLGLQLSEVFYDARDVRMDRSSAAYLARPSARIHEQAYDATVGRAAIESSATALFTGNGGDNVFYNTRSARAIVDRLKREGAFAAWSTLNDVRTMTECSTYQAIAETCRALRRGSHYHWKTQPMFLRQPAIERLSVRPLHHPWLDLPPDGLPGKAAHIGTILRMLPHLEGEVAPGVLPIVNPLASQPLVERCLSLPSWLMVSGGRDRSVVRAGFAGLLPSEIIDRRSKGGPDTFAIEILRANLSEIRERLLDGRIASMDLLDRDAIEQALTPRELGVSMGYVQLLSLIDCEAWIGNWIERNQRAVGLAADAIA